MFAMRFGWRPEHVDTLPVPFVVELSIRLKAEHDHNELKNRKNKGT